MNNMTQVLQTDDGDIRLTDVEREAIRVIAEDRMIPTSKAYKIWKDNMTQSKPTPGRWKHFWYKNMETEEVDCGVVSEHGYSVCRAPRYEKKDQWEVNAEFICDAKEILDKTQLTPKQLLAQRDGLLELLGNNHDAPMDKPIELWHQDMRAIANDIIKLYRHDSGVTAKEAERLFPDAQWYCEILESSAKHFEAISKTSKEGV